MQATTGVKVFAVGDWVQALRRVIEDDFLGDGGRFTHAEPGALGHVLDVPGKGWVNVYFERTRTVTVCRDDEIAVLCDVLGAVPDRRSRSGI